MTVNPQAQKILDAAAKAEAEGMPTPKELGAVALRDVFKKTRGAMNPPAPDVSLIEDVSIPGPGGDIPARYYRPSDADPDEKLPVVMYYHGGGWMVGDIQTHDVICRMAANRGGFAVVNVDYRLAPEHKFPAAVDDTWASVEWALAGADGRAIDPSRVAVGGDSAGGNLSAVAAIMARDAGINLAFQALIYPATRMALLTESHKKFGKGYLLTAEYQEWVHECYLRNDADRDDWRASPELAEDLTGVAPAYVMTCGYDPLVDEGKAYADRLSAAGVPCTYRCFKGQVHGFITMGGVIDEANEALFEVSDAVAAAFRS